MKTITILRFLTFLGSGLTTIAALDLTGIANLLDPGRAQYLLIAGPAALAVKELVVVLGDLFDDGKPNKSFKIGLFCFAMALLTLPLLSSCTALPGVTGEFISKDGRIRVHPDGRVEIVVEPRTSK
jgi:hypothetical protein